MSDVMVGIAPKIREELAKITIASISLEKDADGAITGGTITYADGTTAKITIKSA